MTAYCSTDDLLLGNLPLGQVVDAQKMTNDSADEIDSKIGFRFQTPVDINSLMASHRPSALLLKRLNAILATGRILVTLDIPDENDRIHALGSNYIREAQATLNLIANGSMELPGAVLLNEIADQNTGPRVVNVDSGSLVQGFYEYLDPTTTPAWLRTPYYG
jgi:hypothetical protein